MRGSSIAKSVSMDGEVYRIIENFRLENNMSFSNALAVLVKHGAIRMKEKDLMYTQLAPTTETDPISK